MESHEPVLPPLPPRAARLPFFSHSTLLQPCWCWRGWNSPRVLLPLSPPLVTKPLSGCADLLVEVFFPAVFQNLGKRSRQWLEPSTKVPNLFLLPTHGEFALLPQFPPFVGGGPVACWDGWLQGESGKNSISGDPLYGEPIPVAWG